MTIPVEVAVHVLDLGLRGYDEVLRLQRDLVAARQRDEVSDTLLLVEHPEVITLGRGTRPENLLATTGVPVVEIERGGDVTYHGPGQLVGYPIFFLREGERDLHRYLRNVEEALIQACTTIGVATARKPEWTGVWTASDPQRKLASIGVACKRWVTLHGFALNVATDLSRFAMINPCGLDASAMTSLTRETNRDISLDEVKEPIARAFADVFERPLNP